MATCWQVFFGKKKKKKTLRSAKTAIYSKSGEIGIGTEDMSFYCG